VTAKNDKGGAAFSYAEARRYPEALPDPFDPLE